MQFRNGATKASAIILSLLLPLQQYLVRINHDAKIFIGILFRSLDQSQKLNHLNNYKRNNNLKRYRTDTGYSGRSRTKFLGCNNNINNNELCYLCRVEKKNS